MRLSSHGSTSTSVTCRARSVCAADPPPLFVGARSRRHLTDPLGSSPPAYGLAHHPGEPPHGTPPRNHAVDPPLGPQGPGPVGARAPRAADAQRAGQEGRRRAQRPGPDREHLLQGRLRLDRPGRPARPDALVGPLHPAPARHRRRQDRGPRAARARRRVLHAAGPHRRRPAHAPSSCGSIARDLARSSPATPPTSPTGRTSSCTGSGSRTCPEIWRRLEAVGLSTTEACGDTPRVILGSPVAGIAADEILDGTPAVDAIQRAVHRRRRSSPTCRASSRPRSAARRCRTSSTRSTTSRSSASCTPSTARASTSGSAAACRPTRCWPSGSAPGCRWTRCPTVWAGVVGVFRDYGYRRLRTRARIKFLVADWGVEKFRQVLEEEYLGRALDRRAGSPGAVRSRATTSACTGRRTAATTSGSRRRSAGSPAPTLARLADVAEAHGSQPGADHAAPEARRPRRARPTGSTPWSTPPPGWGCGPSRAPSGATRWPAPASSSASWRSSRPRPAAPS